MDTVFLDAFFSDVFAIFLSTFLKFSTTVTNQSSVKFRRMKSLIHGNVANYANVNVCRILKTKLLFVDDFVALAIF